MSALPQETPMHAEPCLSRPTKWLWPPGLVHHREQAPAQLHGLDETPCRQPSGQRDLQPPHVGGGTGVWQHWYDEAAEPLQPAGQEEGAGPVAAILPGAQY